MQRVYSNLSVLGLLECAWISGLSSTVTRLAWSGFVSAGDLATWSLDHRSCVGCLFTSYRAALDIFEILLILSGKDVVRAQFQRGAELSSEPWEVPRFQTSTKPELLGVTARNLPAIVISVIASDRNLQ